MAYTDAELNEMAVLAIFNYFDEEYSKEYIKDNFKLAIKVLINNSKALFDVNRVAGVNSISQGSQSISFDSSVQAFSLTDDVLSLLPKKRNYHVW